MAIASASYENQLILYTANARLEQTSQQIHQQSDGRSRVVAKNIRVVQTYVTSS